MSPTSNLRGIIAMVLAMGMFIASDSVSKFVFARVPMFEVMTVRAFVGAVLCLILVVVMDQHRHLPRAFHPLVLARGGAEVVANFAFTIALINMPIADLTAIAQTAPLMIILGAALLFGERLGWSRLVLIALGLSGALLVAQPGASAASPYAAFGFLVAIAATARDLVTRKVPGDVPASVAAFAVLACLTVVSFICTLAFEAPVMPGAADLGLMVAAGALMVGGHVGIFLAYTWGQARAVAPFMYSLTVWAALSGLVLFGDRPNLLAMAGMALIVIAGLMVVYVDGRPQRLADKPAALG